MVTDYTLNRYAAELAETLATLSHLELRVLEVAFGFFDTDLARYSKDGQRKLKVNLSELARCLQPDKPGITRGQTVTLFQATVSKLQASGFQDLYREILEAISHQSEIISNP